MASAMSFIGFSIMFLGSQALRFDLRAELQMERNTIMDVPSAELLNDFFIHRDLKNAEFPMFSDLISRSPERVDAMMKFAAQNDRALRKTSNIFAFTHHKAGTILAHNVLRHAAQLTESPWFEQYQGTHKCFSDHTGIYQNLNIETIANLNAQCHDFRAFHIIRESVALTASAYLYHKWSVDTIPGTGPQILKKAKSLQDKLTIEAKANSQVTLPEMVACHEALKDDPRVLTVRMEDFHERFDETVRSIFVHLYGRDFKHLEQLVSAASADDVSRWSPSKLAQTNHIAKDSERDQVLSTLREMIHQHVPATSILPEFDEKMSYTETSN